jgi:hypothetical protein
LVLAAALVRSDAAARAKGFPILGLEAQEARRVAEANCGELGALIFQCEIEMSGSRAFEVGDLAFDPYIGFRASLEFRR